MNGINKGYIGQSHSVRAEEALQRGARPLSGWSKADILEELESIYGEDFAKRAKALTLAELRDQVLEFDSWHHFGKYFNEVNMYVVRDDLKAEDLRHEKQVRKTAGEKKAEEAKHYWLIKFTEWVGKYRKWRKPVERYEIAWNKGEKDQYNVIDRNGFLKFVKRSVVKVEDLGLRKPAKNAKVWERVRSSQND